jgi:type I restriction enzyme S subunit
MNSDWNHISFGEFISLQRGHDLPEQEREDGNVPILGSFGVTGWHSTAKAKAPGLTIGRSGASFGVATYTDKDYFPLNTTLYVTDFNGNNPRFAYYFAKNFDFTAFNSGSAQPSLNRNFINPVEVSIPPRAEQKAIAHILGTLDDKIELNRKTNETLEAMAKALFKSWFVDFDPVRAKAEGRPTGLPVEISDLFPDSFEDSELGEIPSGWRISCVNDLCEWVSSGGTPSRSRKDFWENGNIPWFKTGELNDAPLLDSAEKINELALGNSSCKYWEAGTILFAIYSSPTVGRLGLLTESGTSNQAAAGLKAKGGIGTPFLRRTLLFSRDELQNIAVGAAQQNINVQILKDHKVIAPDSSLATVYSKTISPLDEQQICLAKSTRELCFLRDALLPKLISGEIRIPDAEKILEEVGI